MAAQLTVDQAFQRIRASMRAQVAAISARAERSDLSDAQFCQKLATEFGADTDHQPAVWLGIMLVALCQLATNRELLDCIRTEIDGLRTKLDAGQPLSAADLALLSDMVTAIDLGDAS